MKEGIKSIGHPYFVVIQKHKLKQSISKNNHKKTKKCRDQAPPEEHREAINWTKRSNIIRFTSFLLGGITLAFFALNNGGILAAILDPPLARTVSAPGFTFTAISGQLPLSCLSRVFSFFTSKIDIHSSMGVKILGILNLFYLFREIWPMRGKLVSQAFI
ncbi:hypothetical protein Patl1_08242 [Pistacia atlantica]|uniref:Uncharacterized protein n=1 Tax=Pistacia atlantica TaxID=434234 RepID=A0ACC1AHW5_9ROSI|nr:hypothetical protein Patl1_08242 [Pistacia atlantica]